MSIQNTQWADYDNRYAFDLLLSTLSGWGYVDTSYQGDCFPSISYIGDGDNNFGVRIWVAHKSPLNRVDYGNSTTEETPQFSVHSQFDDCDAVLGYREDFNETYYEGEDIGRVVSVCTAIAPVYHVYSELVGRGYAVQSTGGGCTTWSKDFGKHNVCVGESLSANHITVTNDHGIVVTPDQETGITVYDETGFNLDFVGDENFIAVPLNTCRNVAFLEALGLAEDAAKRGHSATIDCMASLADVYHEMLTKHYAGLGDMWSADELLAEHGHEMTTEQRKLIVAFIRFWDVLNDAEMKS
jgi:hypothetical protein